MDDQWSRAIISLQASRTLLGATDMLATAGIVVENEHYLHTNRTNLENPPRTVYRSCRTPLLRSLMLDY